MENEKKKKKNKKKNKQQHQQQPQQQQNGKKATEDDTASESTAGGGVAEQEQVSELANVQNGGFDLDRHLPNGTETASLEEKIKQLESENDSHLKKQITLEETVKRLQYENDSYMNKEAALEDIIKQLRDVNEACLQKKATLEETIEQLKIDNHSYMQKQAGLQMKIEELGSEKHLWIQKEADLEVKLHQLQDEKASLTSETVSLGKQLRQLEGEKDSWTLTENTTKETISRMNVDITRLRMQVVELEESRNTLLKENQQLSESISGLQLRIQNLQTSVASTDASQLGKHDSGHEDLNSQIEASHAMVEKLVAENAELIEKVSELYSQLGSKNAATDFAGTNGATDLMVKSSALPSIDIRMLESNENSSLSRVSEVEPTTDIPLSSEAESGEIVQIPLEDNEIPDLEVQVVEGANKDEVPLSDAPLIGAPLRLISFVAKYVSGADLVNRN